MDGVLCFSLVSVVLSIDFEENLLAQGALGVLDLEIVKNRQTRGFRCGNYHENSSAVACVQLEHPPHLNTPLQPLLDIQQLDA